MNNTTERPNTRNTAVREAVTKLIKADNLLRDYEQLTAKMRKDAGEARAGLEAAMQEAGVYPGEFIVGGLIVSADPRDGIRVRKAVAL